VLLLGRFNCIDGTCILNHEWTILLQQFFPHPISFDCLSDLETVFVFSAIFSNTSRQKYVVVGCIVFKIGHFFCFWPNFLALIRRPLFGQPSKTWPIRAAQIRADKVAVFKNLQNCRNSDVDMFIFYKNLFVEYTSVRWKVKNSFLCIAFTRTRGSDFGREN